MKASRPLLKIKKVQPCLGNILKETRFKKWFKVISTKKNINDYGKISL